MAKIDAPKSTKELPLVIIKQMSSLATAGFGVVAALAWNEVIKSFVEDYIKPYIGESSGIISLLIYAILVTTLAVLVTLQLSKLEQTFTILSTKISTKKPSSSKK
jgi:large-conductance mechanosensitive channel